MDGTGAKFMLKHAMDIIQALRDCRDRAGLDAAIKCLKEAVCADFFAFGMLTDRHRPFTHCDFPDEWQHEYAARGLREVDPIARYQARSNGSAEYWFRALRAYPIAEYMTLMDLSLDTGLRFGVCSGVRDTGTGRIAVLSVSATHNNFHDQHKILLDIVSPHLYLAMNSERPERPRLTSSEREVLRWVAEGKTNWEISVILRVSENTVRFHLKNINRKLNANSKYHAVAIAMERRIIG